MYVIKKGSLCSLNVALISLDKFDLITTIKKFDSTFNLFLICPKFPKVPTAL